jgi:hypothetical protein
VNKAYCISYIPLLRGQPGEDLAEEVRRHPDRVRQLLSGTASGLARACLWLVHEVAVRFFKDDRGGAQKGIRLTDEVFRLTEVYQHKNLPHEIEARWRLVETAWELNLPVYTLVMSYDSEAGCLIAESKLRRKSVTPCRDALNGYQKGKCFYCFGNVSLVGDDADLAEVDHFFPHRLKGLHVSDPVDGVWNLVLACQTCNRGGAGIFDRLPQVRYLERLHKRNEFLISSHHPLRETLMLQTGQTEQARRGFLQEAYRAIAALLDQAPSGRAAACLWMLGGQGNPMPVLALEQAQTIADHLSEWADSEPAKWFRVHLKERDGRYGLVLFPELQRPLERFRFAHLLEGGDPLGDGRVSDHHAPPALRLRGGHGLRRRPRPDRQLPAGRPGGPGPARPGRPLPPRPRGDPEAGALRRRCARHGRGGGIPGRDPRRAGGAARARLPVQPGSRHPGRRRGRLGGRPAR